MGIKNLKKILKKYACDVFVNKHISNYAYKKLAIDFTLYLCKFKTAMGDRWLDGFVNLIACLRKYDVHCIFCFDGTAPVEKILEQKERRSTRKRSEDRINAIESAIEVYKDSGVVESIIREVYTKHDKECNQRLLINPDRMKSDDFIVSEVATIVQGMRSRLLIIQPEDFTICKELFDLMSIPWIESPTEAETLASDLCKKGLVYGVVTEDTDVLAYSAPIFLNNLNTYSGICIELKYSDILSQLKLNSNEFLDMCIMCGTDYNKNIPGIGPQKSYNYIRQYSSIENFSKHNPQFDNSILKYIRSRELFTEYTMPDITVPYCGMPNFNKLSMFMFRKNINIDIEYLKRCFIESPNKFIVKDSSA